MRNRTDHSSKSPSLLDHVFQFIYAIAGLVMGGICVWGGVKLFLKGITGSSSWTTNVLGFGIELNDAAPGATLFAVGVFIVFITRYKTRG